MSDIKLITIFADKDFVDSDIFCIRTYTNLEELIPLSAPTGSLPTRGFEVRYELGIDTPCYDDPLLNNHIYEEDELQRMREDHKYCSKIGGYASSLQSYPFEGLYHHPAKPQFCLQIDSEEKVGLMWGDAGTLYIARGTTPGFENSWFSEIQFF